MNLYRYRSCHSCHVTCLSRCLFEWDWTIFYHGREKLQVVGLSVGEAEEGMNSIQVEGAECFKAEDREMILAAIIEKHGSTQQLNEKLRKKWGDVAYEAQSHLPKYEGEE